MSKGSKEATETDPTGITRIPKSHAIAERGIKSSGDVRDLMSAVLSDVLTGALTSERANAACNATSKLIKMVELELKWGQAERPVKEIPVAFDREPVAIAS